MPAAESARAQIRDLIGHSRGESQPNGREFVFLQRLDGTREAVTASTTRSYGMGVTRVRVGAPGRYLDTGPGGRSITLRPSMGDTSGSSGGTIVLIEENIPNAEARGYERIFWKRICMSMSIVRDEGVVESAPHADDRSQSYQSTTFV